MWDAVITVFINVLLYIYDFVGDNFGLAIILFTLLTRLITYPLNARQMKSTQAMQDLQQSKEWQDIQKKYKNDKEKLAQEQMRIYQEKGVSPFGSCLPTLIQFPIIIALYQSITRSLAVTPLQLLDLSKHITNGAALIPEQIPQGTAGIRLETGEIIGYQSMWAGRVYRQDWLHVTLGIAPYDPQILENPDLIDANLIHPGNYFGIQINAAERHLLPIRCVD